MDIYADPLTVNCRKVLAGLQFLGVQYNLVNVNYMAGEHAEEPYVSLNPNASLPAMKDGDFTLWESNAILQYAADKSGNSQAYPTELQARANVNRWLLWESSAWFPSCYVYIVENCVKPLMGAEADQALLEAEGARFAKLASILDAALADSQWLCGDMPTIADIAVAAPMHLHGWAQLPLDESPNLVRWMTQQVETLPAWQATHIPDGFGLGE